MIRFRSSGQILTFLIPWICPNPQVLGVQIRQLTRQEAIDNHPVFSPSGQEILFASNRGGTVALMRIPVDGGDPMQVPIGLTGDLYSDWHPDGRSIVFDARGAGGPPDVYRYWMESGELQQLTHDSGMDGQPAFSPDGHQIVFMSMRGGSRDLWIMDSDGENQRQLTHEPGGEWHPRWSPDRQSILFSSDRDGDVDIWIIGVDGTGLRKLTSRPGVEDRGAWSPDGSRVGFQWQGDLWMVDSRGGDPEQLTDFPGGEGNLAWSPDGNSIVFAADISGNINLWLLSLGEGSWLDPRTSLRHRFWSGLWNRNSDLRRPELALRQAGTSVGGLLKGDRHPVWAPECQEVGGVWLDDSTALVRFGRHRHPSLNISVAGCGRRRRPPSQPTVTSAKVKTE